MADVSNVPPLFFDHEINVWWCLSDTWRCTPAEAIGLWLEAFFYGIFLTAVTVIHGFVQNEVGTSNRDEALTRRHMEKDDGRYGSDWCAVFVLFATSVFGCVAWAIAGVRFVHPFQCWPIQLVGSTMLLLCMVAFVVVHVNMAENWSPEPEAKARHRLVTHGLFRWARHPMYAVFLWTALGTAVATLNWVLALYPFGLVWMTLRRIPTEENILEELFAQDYRDYRSRVSALGPPWFYLSRCLGLESTKPSASAIVADASADLQVVLMAEQVAVSS